MHKIDYEKAQELLLEEFSEVESETLSGSRPQVSNKLSEAFDTLFQSKTQAYREVLLGCLIAGILNKSIDITLPYTKQGYGCVQWKNA